MVMVPAEDGHWINEKFAYISEIIHDFDHRLQLVWIPPENRTAFDTKPYGVIHTADNGLQKMVMYLREDEMDERVLQKLFLADTEKNDVLANLEAEELARTVMRNKEKMEQAAARQDFIKSVVKSPLHSFRHKGRIIPK